MIGIVAFFAVLIGACQGATFDIAPYNTSVEIGGTATIACIVSNLGSDSVTWKKVVSGSSTTTISLNTQILASATKYSIVGTYNLTISNVVTDDVALYQCTVGSVTNEAYLNTVILPTNVSVYWESAPRAGSSVNLTCKATYGNPPPFLRWYKNDVDFTQDAYYYTENTLSSGYGDAMSTVAISLLSTDENKLYRCEVHYEGWYRAMEYTLQTQLSGSSALQSSGILAAMLLAAGALLRNM
ncbi:cell adhesion molecule 2-like [Mizuhopecten yessoensis]|uniref:Junctional adhesion molecule C n=1 Tax=Mizuhopecten yessoensis TaxID=6573 RepID=A0A210PGC9_MIZYE|nr:cell adhesion molecule 2-like [Mizuhopecten yessoensis]OWF35554.1 Junctional adhesion molecule C [Mizuhopecten yessoensis]